MKVPVYDMQNQKKGEIALPVQFEEPFHPNLIKRAVLTLQSNRRQPYGASPTAGKRSSVRVSKRRRDYRGSYGKGISRVPRKVMTRRGTQFNWEGAFAPGMVGGRRAHPPQAKSWEKKINKKENQKAIRSALTQTFVRDVVAKKHAVPESYPFVLDNSFEDIKKTKDVLAALNSLGFAAEMKRVSKKTIRAGKGKARGRKYRIKKGPLLVTSENCSSSLASKNIQGVEIVSVNSLNAELLAPGAEPGRLTLFTEKAVQKIGKDKLFMAK